MNVATKTLSLMALYAAVYGTAAAQQPASPPATAPAGPDASAVSGAPATPAKAKKATAQSEAGEPRADTGNTTDPASSAVPAPMPAGRTSSAAPPAPTKAGQTSAGATPAGRAPPVVRTPADPGLGQKSTAKIDRLELGMATVTGDREQPKVMYIVPWKRSDIGDLTGKPMNSLVDEILAPVDRDVFKREVVYYQAVQTEASQNGAPPKPAQQGEK
jgi:hypothetical protein